MPPAKLGLIYGHTGLERFIDVIGVANTRDLFLTGRTVDAERALRMGLVGEVVDDEEIEAASLELAARSPPTRRSRRRATSARSRRWRASHA